MRVAILVVIPLWLSLPTRQAQAKDTPPPAPAVSAAPATVRIAAVGDVMAHRLQLVAAWNPACKCHDFRPVFAQVKDVLSGADLAIGNFETTLPGKDFTGYPRFGSPDALAVALADAGFDVLTTVNNHAIDRDGEGIVRTLEVLKKLGLTRLGTFADDADYARRRVTMVERGGLRIAMLAYTEMTNMIPTPVGVHVNRISPELVTEDLALARRKKPDVIMVFFHFGEQYQREPNARQRATVELAFREGADVVLGSHPHVLQPYELRTIKDRFGREKPRLVAWSLGNFVSNYRMRFADGSAILHFSLVRDAAGVTVPADVSYTPIWTYGERDGDKVRFHVLPIERFADNASAALKLPGKALRRMLLSLADTEALLGPRPDAATRARASR